MGYVQPEDDMKSARVKLLTPGRAYYLFTLICGDNTYRFTRTAQGRYEVASNGNKYTVFSWREEISRITDGAKPIYV